MPSDWSGCWWPVSFTARHHLAKLLLRHEVRFDGRCASTARRPTGPRRTWGSLAGVRLEQAAPQRAL
jgi:hypothetical protein